MVLILYIEICLIIGGACFNLCCNSEFLWFTQDVFTVCMHYSRIKVKVHCITIKRDVNLNNKVIQFLVHCNITTSMKSLYTSYF